MLTPHAAALKDFLAARAILVRDPNRLVSTAVLGSPRLTEAEIESFAGMKSLSDEMLRQIGSHREWTKRYGVISNLVPLPGSLSTVMVPPCSSTIPRQSESPSPVP